MVKVQLLLAMFQRRRLQTAKLSRYDDVLCEMGQKGKTLANQYLVELYNILKDEEKLPPADCRAKIEQDCIDLWSKATIRKYLPPETRDSKKQMAGRIGGENLKKKKEREMLVIATAASENGQGTDLKESYPVSQNEQDSARFILAENASVSQNEQESSTFHKELDQQLSNRTLSPELLGANKIIADRDREIQELKKDREELLKENPVRGNAIPLLFLQNKLAMEIYDAIRDDISSSAGTITGFNLEHDGEEITAIYQVNRT